MKKLFITLTLALLALTAQAKQKEIIRVSCVGNSITYGTGLSDPVKDSYPSQLQVLLGDAYQVGRFGKPGATLLNKAYRPYMQQQEFHDAMNFKGDIAVIHLGVNDTDPRAWPNYRDYFVSDYSALIDSLRKANPKCRVIVARMTPLSDRHHRFLSGTRDWHAQIQEAIETVAQVKDCELIDFYEPLHCRPELFPDAIHPNKEGYGIMAQIVYSAITGDYGGLQLPACYTSGMVLPRNRSFELKGKANAGEKVEVELAGQKHTATANNRGEWSVEIRPLATGGPYTLTAKANSRTLKLDDILAGELWLCSGQSNMEFMLRQSQTAQEDIAQAGNSQIRFLDLKGKWATANFTWSPEALDSVNHLLYYNTPQWKACTSETAAPFSAIGYHFARELQDSLQCPIGVVCNAIGGSGIESWIDRTTLEYEMPNILRDWTHNDFIQDWVRGRAEKNMGEGHAALQRHPYQPSYLYEASIQELKALPINGVVWYQGESNAHCVESYEQMFHLLLKSWRKTWQQPNLPFFYVQLSSLNRPSWPWFRDSQRRLMDTEQHIGMAVSTDLGDSLDVHPRNKRPIGHRLALWALHDVYGKTSLLPSGPLPESVTFRGKDVLITMQYGEGMHTSNGKEIATLEVACEEGRFYPAKAVIEGNTLRVWSDSVANPRFVRYGWQPFTRANLVNREGLPASTFRLEAGKDLVRCATMNIRYDNKDDRKKGLGWKERKQLVADYVNTNAPDLMGMQEVLHNQAEDLKRLLPEYTFVGVGREDGKQKGEYAALWYRSSLFDAVESGNFWLSETPEQPGSMGWDAACTRMVTWAKLRNNRTGKTFLFANTHMDHRGATARQESARLIIRKLKELGSEEMPVILTGDMNADESSETYRTLTTSALTLNDALKLSEHHTGVSYTWHDFNRMPEKQRSKIDYIFVTPNVKVKSTSICAPNEKAMASDHCFFLANMQI